MSLLALAALACSDLTIDGPQTVPEHRAVRLAASVAPSADAIVLWDVQPLGTDGALPAGDADVEILREEPGAFWFNAGPGRYAVRLVVKEPKAPQRSARAAVVVQPRVPRPAPNPQPGPKPDPLPASTKVVVTVVDDAANRPPEFGALFASPAWRQALVAEGHRWHWLDAASELLVAQRLDRAVREAGGPPALIVQAPDGRVLSSVKCPVTDAALLVAVRAAAGKKEVRP